MSNCEGCDISPKGQREAFDIATQQAVQWMNENREAVAIYVEGYEYHFMKASLAIEQQKLIKDVIMFKG